MGCGALGRTTRLRSCSSPRQNGAHGSSSRCRVLGHSRGARVSPSAGVASDRWTRRLARPCLKRYVEGHTACACSTTSLHSPPEAITKGILLEFRYRKRALAYFGRIIRRACVFSAAELDTLLAEAVARGELSESEAEAAHRSAAFRSGSSPMAMWSHRRTLDTMEPHIDAGFL